MKKIAGFTLVLFIVALEVSCSTPPKQESTQVPDNIPPMPVVENVTSELPKLNLTNLDGTHLDMSVMKGKKIIFILFQPDCDHCQNEAKQISTRIAAFSKYEVYFLSSAPVKEIEKFSVTYKLNTTKNFHFANTDVQGVIDSFGPIPAPSIFIYSEDGKQVNKFEGEMELDVVIKYL